MRSRIRPNGAGLSRRAFLAAPMALAVPLPAAGAAVLGDDGLYREDWYLDSFLDLPEDAAAAAADGKHFAVEWGQRGCPYCKWLHTVYFADPAIEAPIRSAFAIAHLDLNGAREVTAMDGDRMTEKALAARSGIRLTPTFQFFAVRDGVLAEVARMPGLLEEDEFSAMFRYVATDGWRTLGFEEWRAREASRG
jgi:thioredoxin-related protein